MHGYNTIETQIFYPKHINMVESRVYYKHLVECSYNIERLPKETWIDLDTSSMQFRNFIFLFTVLQLQSRELK